jgi:hypothetical protein
MSKDLLKIEGNKNAKKYDEPGKVFEKPIQKKSINKWLSKFNKKTQSICHEINDGTKTKEKMKNNLCNLIK